MSLVFIVSIANQCFSYLHCAILHQPIGDHLFKSWAPKLARTFRNPTRPSKTIYFSLGHQKGLRDRISPTCTLSQNGYGDILACQCFGSCFSGVAPKRRARMNTLKLTKRRMALSCDGVLQGFPSFSVSGFSLLQVSLLIYDIYDIYDIYIYIYIYMHNDNTMSAIPADLCDATASVGPCCDGGSCLVGRTAQKTPEKCWSQVREMNEIWYRFYNGMIINVLVAGFGIGAECGRQITMFADGHTVSNTPDLF
jgi:hypothetical protein